MTTEQMSKDITEEIIPLEELPAGIKEIILHNPYCVLGLPTTASKEDARQRRDEMDALSDLGVEPEAYPMDIPLIEAPPRDKAHAQQAIQEMDETDHLWLWFSHENAFASVMADKGPETEEGYYDWLLAYYMYALLVAEDFEDYEDERSTWKQVLPIIGDLYAYAEQVTFEKYLFPHAKKRIEDDDLGIKEVVISFRRSFIRPLLGNLRAASLSGLRRFASFYYTHDTLPENFSVMPYADVDDAPEKKIRQVISDRINQVLEPVRTKAAEAEKTEGSAEEQQARAETFLEEAERFAREDLPDIRLICESAKNAPGDTGMIASQVVSALLNGLMRCHNGFKPLQPRSVRIIFDLLTMIEEDEPEWLDRNVLPILSNGIYPPLPGDFSQLNARHKQMILDAYLNVGLFFEGNDALYAGNDDTLFRYARLLYEHEKYAQALPLMEQLFAKGYLFAAWYLFEAAFFGYGMPADAERAEAYINRMVQEVSGKKEGTNYRAARSMLLYAAAVGHPRAGGYAEQFCGLPPQQFLLSAPEKLEKAEECESAGDRNLVLYYALSVLRMPQAKKEDHVLAMLYQAAALYRIDPPERNIAAAARIQKKIADLPDEPGNEKANRYIALANEYFGMQLYEGDGVPADRTQAIAYLQRAAAAGNEKAVLYMQDRGLGMKAVTGFRDYDKRALDRPFLTDPVTGVASRLSDVFLTPSRGIAMRFHLLNPGMGVQSLRLDRFIINGVADEGRQYDFRMEPAKVMPQDIVFDELNIEQYENGLSIAFSARIAGTESAPMLTIDFRNKRIQLQA